MMWNIGSTFLSDTLTPGAKHLHVLVTKPYQRQDGELVVIAAILSYNGNSRGQESTCVLTENDGHPFIIHPSYVKYASCIEVSLAQLDEELSKQKIRVYPRFNLQARRKILEGLYNSPRARSNYVLIACNQLEEINWEEE